MLSILLVIVGQAGASPPSLTTGARRLYIYIYLFILYVRPFWPPGGPALRANVAGRIGVESDYSCYYAIYILVVRICQTSKVRTKADTAMNSDETHSYQPSRFLLEYPAKAPLIPLSRNSISKSLILDRALRPTCAVCHCSTRPLETLHMRIVTHRAPCELSASHS